MKERRIIVRWPDGRHLETEWVSNGGMNGEIDVLIDAVLAQLNKHPDVFGVTLAFETRGEDD